jgi:hypothetical protein
MGRWVRGVAVAVALLGLGCGFGGDGAAPQVLRRFGDATPIAREGVVAADGGWRVTRASAESVPLFELPDPGVESTTLFYRAQLRSENVVGKAYLEMWVRVPGRGEFFSRGLAHALSGTTGWSEHEIPFLLNEPGVRPDLVRLNLAFDGGGGTVWIRNVTLLSAPASGS